MLQAISGYAEMLLADTDPTDPRHEGLAEIRKAARVKIPTLTASDLGVDAPAPVVQMDNYRKPPARDAHVQLFDNASDLVDALLAEKVL